MQFEYRTKPIRVEAVQWHCGMSFEHQPHWLWGAIDTTHNRTHGKLVRVGDRLAKASFEKADEKGQNPRLLPERDGTFASLIRDVMAMRRVEAKRYSIMVGEDISPTIRSRISTTNPISHRASATVRRMRS
jgi:hypothetical protein